MITVAYFELSITSSTVGFIDKSMKNIMRTVLSQQNFE